VDADASVICKGAKARTKPFGWRISTSGADATAFAVASANLASVKQHRRKRPHVAKYRVATTQTRRRMLASNVGVLSLKCAE
jgi:hypothetical protein